jgi:hypothetical protein
MSGGIIKIFESFGKSRRTTRLTLDSAAAGGNSTQEKLE